MALASTTAKKAHAPKKPLDVSLIDTRLLLTLAEAGYLLRKSESRMYRLVREIDPLTRKPKLLSFKDGKHRLIPRREIDRYIEAQIHE